MDVFYFDNNRAMKKVKALLSSAWALVVMAIAWVTSSGAILSWEPTDFTKFNTAGTAVSTNSFLTLDLLPYYILVLAVTFILGRAFGVFKFGGWKK